MPDSADKLELIRLCFKVVLLQIFSKQHIHGAHSFTKLYCPKDQCLKHVNKFLFLLKQRSSTAYNKKAGISLRKSSLHKQKRKVQES